MAFQLRKLFSDSRTGAGSLTYTCPGSTRATIKHLDANFTSANNGDTVTFTATIGAKAHVLCVAVASTAGAQKAKFTSQVPWGAGVIGTPTTPFFVNCDEMVLEAGDTLVMAITGAGSPLCDMSLSGIQENL